MRVLITVINGLVAGGGAWAYLNAETWAGSIFIALAAGFIILYGESIRRTLGDTPITNCGDVKQIRHGPQGDTNE